MPRRPLLAALVALLAACDFGEPLPKPAPRPEVVSQPEPGALTNQLQDAERRYAGGIECWTDYFFEMRDLAEIAPRHLTELVASLRTGVAAGHALIVLHLMGDDALLAVPLLEELLDHPDPEVRRRAQLGIDAASEAAALENNNCAPGKNGGATEQDVAADGAQS